MKIGTLGSGDVAKVLPMPSGTPEEYMKAMDGSGVKVYPMAPGDKLQF